jgi:hypothetical protein
VLHGELFLEVERIELFLLKEFEPKEGFGVEKVVVCIFWRTG